MSDDEHVFLGPVGRGELCRGCMGHVCEVTGAGLPFLRNESGDLLRLKTVPGIRSWNGNSGSVHPVHGMPARVFDDCLFQRIRLQGEWVIGPRQPNS